VSCFSANQICDSFLIQRHASPSVANASVSTRSGAPSGQHDGDVIAPANSPLLNVKNYFRLAVDIPQIAVFAEAAREPARFAVEFMGVFKKAGISSLGPISTIPNFVSETGILVGLIDPEKPSELANKYIEVLRSAALEIGTTKCQMVISTPSKNIDFDLYVCGY
jgi:hypothetical protein